MVKVILSFLLIILNSITAFSQENVNTDEDNINYTEEVEQKGWATQKEYTSKEKRAACKKYNNKYVSYYDDIYFVEGCYLRQIIGQVQIKDLTGKGVKIYRITGETIAKLKKGKPFINKTKEHFKCSKFNGNYITYNYTDIYYVSNCKIKHFPDWETYLEHRKNHHKIDQQIIGIDWKSFNRFKKDGDFISVLDKAYKKESLQNKDIEILPISEACKGLNGKDVSYINKIYKIEKCHKRSYDPSKYLKNHYNQKMNLIELSDSVWYSLPDGRPMSDSKPHK